MIRIGPAGWSYKDWNGVVYPQPRPRGFDPLRYLSQYFSTIEINSSFYGAPKAETAKKWVLSVEHRDDFRFTAKLFQSFTHNRQPAPLDEKEFKEGLAPIVDAGRLGALLLQFPWSFKNEKESRDYLVHLQRRFREYPLVLEVRHSSWMEEEILDVSASSGWASAISISRFFIDRFVQTRVLPRGSAMSDYTAAITNNGSRRTQTCENVMITFIRSTNSNLGLIGYGRLPRMPATRTSWQTITTLEKDRQMLSRSRRCLVSKT